METDTILHGDASAMLRTLPDGAVHTIVTSPPYWGLRDYGVPGQIGLEPTPEDWVARMVETFREARRVLRNDGTLWVNVGDSYATDSVCRDDGMRSVIQSFAGDVTFPRWREYAAQGRAKRTVDCGLKRKDLIGLPWMLAFALRADGWYLRADIVWHKSNVMPESITDRPTRAHEYVFLLAKSERYYYDAAAIREPVTGGAHPRACGRNSRKYVDRDPAHLRGVSPKSAKPGQGIKANTSFHAATTQLVAARNRRSVWTMATAPYTGAHFATFPPALIEPCVLAGCPAGGVVLDPFMGAGTTALVALRHSRHYLGIELNADYIRLAEDRLAAGVQRVLWSA